LETFADILAGPDIVAHCVGQHAIEKYRHWLSDGYSRLWLAEAAPGFAPVGYLLLTKPDLPLADLRPSDWEIKRIYLLHRFQGAGIGARLMDEALLRARELSATRLLLGVYAKNEAALSFYQRLGFTEVGTRRFKVGANLYDDLVLALPLEKK